MISPDRKPAGRGIDGPHRDPRTMTLYQVARGTAKPAPGRDGPARKSSTRAKAPARTAAKSKPKSAGTPRAASRGTGSRTKKDANALRLLAWDNYLARSPVPLR